MAIPETRKWAALDFPIEGNRTPFLLAGLTPEFLISPTLAKHWPPKPYVVSDLGLFLRRVPEVARKSGGIAIRKTVRLVYPFMASQAPLITGDVVCVQVNPWGSRLQPPAPIPLGPYLDQLPWGMRESLGHQHPGPKGRKWVQWKASSCCKVKETAKAVTCLVLHL